MSHQNDKMKAQRVSFEPEPEKKQPEEYQSLEEALTGVVQSKEPEGEPSF